ncbi:MAG: efflux RND transporter periplasmic adaptor subunit [Bacteroidales bacterium]|nr:MAG: efflux RND transporter periplasmic adaptor subunit [Bacteroidales bacterium]
MKNKKLFRIILVVTILAIILAVVGKRVGWFGKEETFEVAVEKGKTRTITETITANGKVQPETEVKLTPEVSGEIVELNVKEGDYVTKGKLLVKIKPDIYISAVDRAKATLNSAKARLEQAEAQHLQSRLSHERNEKLWEQKTISRSDFEASEASYKMALADRNAASFSVNSAEASLKEAQENLIKTTIYAPMSGTVSMLNIELGERVLGTQMMTGTELMRIADLNRMEVLVEVNENDIIRVKINDTAIVEIDAYLDYKFRGVVTEIANSATSTGVSVDQVTSFDVKILLLRESYADLITERFPNPFRPGMSATVDIQTETKTDILSIPIQAVTTRIDTSEAELDAEGYAYEIDEEPKEVVFIIAENMVLLTEVETGIQDNNFIEIISGLTEEEAVVVAPYSAISRRLQDSSLIEIVTKEKLFSADNK